MEAEIPTPTTRKQMQETSSTINRDNVQDWVKLPCQIFSILIQAYEDHIHGEDSVKGKDSVVQPPREKQHKLSMTTHAGFFPAHGQKGLEVAMKYKNIWMDRFVRWEEYFLDEYMADQTSEDIQKRWQNYLGIIAESMKKEVDVTPGGTSQHSLKSYLLYFIYKLYSFWEIKIADEKCAILVKETLIAAFECDTSAFGKNEKFLFNKMKMTALSGFLAQAISAPYFLINSLFFLYREINEIFKKEKVLQDSYLLRRLDQLTWYFTHKIFANNLLIMRQVKINFAGANKDVTFANLEKFASSITNFVKEDLQLTTDSQNSFTIKVNFYLDIIKNLLESLMDYQGAMSVYQGIIQAEQQPQLGIMFSKLYEETKNRLIALDKSMGTQLKDSVRKAFCSLCNNEQVYGFFIPSVAILKELLNEIYSMGEVLSNLSGLNPLCNGMKKYFVTVGLSEGMKYTRMQKDSIRSIKAHEDQIKEFQQHIAIGPLDSYALISPSVSLDKLPAFFSACADFPGLTQQDKGGVYQKYVMYFANNITANIISMFCEVKAQYITEEKTRNGAKSKDADKKDQLSPLIEYYNKVNAFVSQQIVLQTNRATLNSCIRFFLAVAKQLKETSNFHGFMAVFTAVSFVVGRFEAQKIYILNQNVAVVYNDLIEFQDKELPQSIKKCMDENTVCIPFTQHIEEEVARIKEGTVSHPSYNDKAKSADNDASKEQKRELKKYIRTLKANFRGKADKSKKLMVGKDMQAIVNYSTEDKKNSVEFKQSIYGVIGPIEKACKLQHQTINDYLDGFLDLHIKKCRLLGQGVNVKADSTASSSSTRAPGF